MYRVETKDGVVFTDQPPSDENVEFEEIELQPLNTAPPPDPQAIPPGDNSNAQPKAPPPPAVTITSPADETTIAMGPGDFSVAATASPPLRRSEQLQLLIDGEPWETPQKAGAWTVRGALRGPHDLVVQRLTQDRVVSRSESVRVYVLRPSVLRR